MTDTVSHTEYTRLNYFGVAGPATDLDEATAHRLRHDNADWKGRYWRYAPVTEDSDLLRIEPVNVAGRSKDPR
ncbi:hypothetical protein [Nocardia alni]|uniref:hypothetical protein n=1 Tax=Nocardia alni TaxID=2815723 RepID=UPI001C23D71A|nr:hypothetical protein [Nocardia alni]